MGEFLSAFSVSRINCCLGFNLSASPGLCPLLTDCKKTPGWCVCAAVCASFGLALLLHLLPSTPLVAVAISPSLCPCGCAPVYHSHSPPMFQTVGLLRISLLQLLQNSTSLFTALPLSHPSIHCPAKLLADVCFLLASWLRAVFPKEALMRTSGGIPRLSCTFAGSSPQNIYLVLRAVVVLRHASASVGCRASVVVSARISSL